MKNSILKMQNKANNHLSMFKIKVKILNKKKMIYAARLKR